jgi:RNA-directed DNA polymerase
MASQWEAGDGSLMRNSPVISKTLSPQINGNSPTVESAYQKAKWHFGIDVASQVLIHARHYELQLAQLREAIAQDNRGKTRFIQQIILTSYSAKLVCLIRSLKVETKLTWEEVVGIAKTLNPKKDCGEAVFVWAEPKASGFGWRPVCAFGPKRTALQTLCADILLARFGFNPSDYLRKGKGAECASDKIVDLVIAGYEYFVLTDIKNFFRSVQKKGLHKVLGLPKAVVENSLLIGSDASLSLGDCLHICAIETLDGAAREGLPTGSRASQIVASILLGPALEQLASVDRIVVHGDDVAIGASSNSEATALLKALTEAVELHPFGPFRLKRYDIKHINDGFYFCQYRHKRDWLTGKVKRRPSDNGYKKYSRNIARIAAEKSPKEAWKAVAIYRWHWINSYRRWPWNIISKTLLYISTLEAFAQGSKQYSKKPVQ